jgi:NodT family efflux transporter outer membrane factor (OMF) lipoprotein
MHNKSLLYLLVLSLALLDACTHARGPLTPPQVQMPEKWDTNSDALVKEQVSWWKNFNDPQLDGLIERALLTNNDFAAAVIRVRRAQLQAGLVDTNRTPSIAAGANVGLNHTFNPQATNYTSGVSASMNYELDLWGKLSSQRDAAHWEAQASDADCKAFAISLLGTTTRLYWQLAYLNQLLSLNTADIDSAEKTLALTKARYKAGAVSALNTVQAELNVSIQQASRTQLIQQRVEARHALAILFNQPPQSDVVDPPALPNLPLPAVAAGLPAEILANRPDLRATELRLRESLVNVDVTRKSFYPTVNLTSSIGTASSALLSFLQNPIATLGAGLSLPFIQWNTTKLAIRVSKTQYEEAVVNYRQHLYIALAEVEDSLSARAQLMAEESKLVLARSQAQHAESISHVRFKAGFTDVQLWLDAQASLRGVERSVVLNRLNQLNNQVNLYKALGLGASSNSISCDKSSVS